MDHATEPAPDGGHYTPEVHREIGRALAPVILDWASQQAHLSPATVDNVSPAAAETPRRTLTPS